MFEIIFALAKMYRAFYSVDHKTDQQFNAMDAACAIFKQYPEETKRASEALELI